jgi:hypothetical protein
VDKITIAGFTRPRVMLVALSNEQTETLAVGLSPIQIVCARTLDEAVPMLSSVFPLAVAVSCSLGEAAIGALADLAQACASELVIIDGDVLEHSSLARIVCL